MTHLDRCLSLAGQYACSTGHYDFLSCRCKNMQELLDFTAQHFNAIRMPFSAELALNMEQRTPGNIDYAANPDLAGLTTGQVMDR